MDIISHGLWGGIAFGRKNRKNFLISFLIGMASDLLSFGVFNVATWLGLAERVDFRRENIDQLFIPQYVHTLYDITHSLAIFFAVFLLVWLIRKKPLWILGAWFLHIIIDIPTHSFQFFPTPFLWPFSNYMVNGISWGEPIIFFPDVIILILLYAIFFWKKQRDKKLSTGGEVAK